MNVRDLKNVLEDLDDDMEVRFASQPNWPFEYSITDAVVIDLSEEYYEDDEEEKINPDAEPNEIVYLVEGQQLGYLPGLVSNKIGWQ